MNTTQSNRRPAFFRIASGLGLGLLLLAGSGCDAGLTLRPKAPTFVAQAQFGGAAGSQPAPSSSAAMSEPAAAYPAAPAPAPSGSYQQFGGASAASATLAAVGTRVEGRVSKGAPRYFALDLSVGDSLAFKIYCRKLDEDSSVSFRLLEPDNVALTNRSEFIMAPSTEYERSRMSATVGQAGRHILVIKASQPAEFRIDIEAVNLAGN